MAISSRDNHAFLRGTAGTAGALAAILALVTEYFANSKRAATSRPCRARYLPPCLAMLLLVICALPLRADEVAVRPMHWSELAKFVDVNRDKPEVVIREVAEWCKAMDALLKSPKGTALDENFILSHTVPNDDYRKIDEILQGFRKNSMMIRESLDQAKKLQWALSKLSEEEAAARLSAARGLPLPAALELTNFTVRCMVGAIECDSGEDPKRIARAVAKEYKVSRAFAESMLEAAEDALRHDSRRRMVLNLLDRLCQEKGLPRELISLGAGAAADVMAMMDGGATAEQVRLKLGQQANPAMASPQEREMHAIFRRWLPEFHGLRDQVKAGADLETVGKSIGLDQAPAIVQLIFMQVFARYV